jgi:hypothetical protein
MNLSADVKKLELLTLKENSITVDNIINTLFKYNPDMKFVLTDSAEVKKQIIYFLQRNLLQDKALSLHLDTHKNVVDNLALFKERILIRMINQQDIFAAGEPTDEEVYQYYVDHKNDIYSYFKNRKYDMIKKQVRRDLQRILSTEKKNKWLAEKKIEYKVAVFDNILREINNDETT